MKRMILVLLSVVGFQVCVLAQENPKFVYCEIVGTSQPFSTKVTVVVDFGEKMSVWVDNRMKDEKTGKAIKFNSMIDALNFMGKRGWLFSQAYSVSYSNSQVYHYLLYKPFDEMDEDAKKELQKN